MTSTDPVHSLFGDRRLLPLAGGAGPRAVLLALLAAPCSAQLFVDVTAASGLTTAPYSSSPYGSGIAVADIDGDGHLDVVCGAQGNTALNVYRGVGGFTFVDVTATAQLTMTGGRFHGLHFADIDNDGDQDLYLSYWRAPPALFINDGTGVFSEQAAARGLNHVFSSYAVTFGDYDRDGWLDVYVVNRQDQVTGFGEPNILYRNVGGGVFVDVTAATGTGDAGLGYAALFCDYDGDMWPDLLVTNDKGAIGLPNELYRNLGNGTFAAVGAAVGANVGINGMGNDIADAYCDGGMAIACSDSAPTHLLLGWDSGLGQYVDISQASGMFTSSDGWATHFLDYDNDGWQDLHFVNAVTPNSLYRNPGLPLSAFGYWIDHAPLAGLAFFHQQHCTALADFDQDGWLDFCHRNHVGGLAAPTALTLLCNTGCGKHWLSFATVGTVSNRDGIGARVVVHTGSHVQRQWVRSGEGYLSTSSRRLHFGCGNATVAELVDVTWPSGQRQQLRDVPTDQRLTLVEPRFELTGAIAPGGTSSLELVCKNEPSMPYAMFLSFSPTPATVLPDGRALPVAFDALSLYTLSFGNVLVSAPIGLLDANGEATSVLAMPNQPSLSGQTLYATAVTFGPTFFPDIRTIFPTAVEIAIQ